MFKKNGKKFVVLCTARSGSNLLMNLLENSSKDIKTNGELFNLTTLDSDELKKALTDPIGYLNQKLKTSFFANKVSGFKLFYYHATRRGFGNNNLQLLKQASVEQKKQTRSLVNEIRNNYNLSQVEKNFSELWQYLRDHDYEVIHLKRKNLLESLVSLKKAYITNQWTKNSTQRKSEVSIVLTKSECEVYFETISSYEAAADHFFRQSHLIEVDYEDLLSNRKAVVKKLEKFLDIKTKYNDSHWKKQEERPLSQALANYRELKDLFSKTQWSKFFTD